VGVLVNVATGEARDETFTADSLAPLFSPCGDAFAYVVKQLALPDLTDVYLYGTLEPLGPPLGSANLPFSALEVHATAAEHRVLQGGVPTFLAANDAGDACTPPPNDPPVADFDAPSGAIAGSAASFTDQSTDADGTVVAWSWSFGDGATSSSRNPSHTYAAPGTYEVTLTVRDDDGATDTVERTVGVCGSLANLAGRILYQEGGERDLYVLDLATGARVRLTNGANGYSQIRSGRFSPDGTRIAYADQGTFVAGIWVMDADGTNRRRLTDGGGPHGDFDFHEVPSWSPDGEWIAFANRDVVTPANQGLWMVRADGTAPAKIANTSLVDYGPDFMPGIAGGCAGLSPAQRGPGCYTIAFNHRETSTSAYFARIAGDGTGFAPFSGSSAYGNARISPDGTEVLYERFLGLFGPLGGVHRIFRSPLPIGAATQITSGGDDVFWYPAWSPDGDAIAYSFSVDGVPGTVRNLEIGVSDPTGCSSRVLLSGAGHQNVQDWSTGGAVQALGSVAGKVRLGSANVAVPNAVVELIGDHHAFATADANGDFLFENIPIGASFTIRFVSAPGYMPFPAAPPSFTSFTGSTVAVFVYADRATATMTGVVREDLVGPVADVVVTAVGEGETITATTDANGAWALTIQNWGDYVFTPSKPGWRFEPPSVGGTFSNGRLDFVAIPLPPPGRIAFTSSRTGDEDVWLADSDGANAVNVTDRSGAQRDAAWSPDGRRLAYASDENGAGLELRVHELESENDAGLEVFGREPAWSPDGSQIAFASDIGLQSLDVAAGTVSPLTSDPSDASPAWRPDGSAIVFERAGVDGSGLWEISTSGGSAPAPLVDYGGDDRDPAFAAVGGGFAHATHYGDPSAPLSILATWETGGWVWSNGENPTWSQDGNQIAYDHAGSIHRVDPRVGWPALVADSGSDRDPSWQPSAVAACANGADDDGDGWVDAVDTGCTDESDPSERNDLPGCDNGLDDDGDGLADAADPGCPFPFAPYEDPLCDNGLDDDGDGATDFADETCSAGWPYQEQACGLGAELALVLAMLRLRMRRKEA
jgi:Tol biopolymer transport system component